METWTRMGGLFALGLTFAGCGSADAAAPVPAAAVGAVPAVAPVAPPPAPAVTVASCESTSPSGRLCVEFNQSQYATMTAAGAAGLCTRELGTPIRVNVPCAPNDRMGACDIGTHVLYSYWVPDASADAYRRLCGTTSGRFLAGGGMGEPGADSVHPDANATITVGQVVLYLCSDRCTATYIARVVDVLPDGRVTVEYRGDRETVARDHLWVGSFTPVPDGLGNSEADDFPTITETPLPVGTEVWAKDTWWYRGRVAEDTGGARLGVDLYGFVGEPQQFTRRNVRLHR